MASGVLHGITAVAELKRCGLRQCGRRAAVLHGITAVAELKQAHPGLVLQLLQVLHGITAVAELKLDHVNAAADPRSPFSTASPPWPN